MAKVHSMVAVRIKWALTNSGETSWPIIMDQTASFLKSPHHGLNSSQRFIDSENKRYYIILSESAKASSLDSRTFSSFGTLAAVMIRPQQISRSVTMSTVCQTQSITLCISEWFTPSRSTQWRIVVVALHRHWQMQELTSRLCNQRWSMCRDHSPHSPLQAKRSQNSTCQSSSQTSWSGWPSPHCSKRQGHHQRSCQNTSSITSQSASHPGGWIHLSRKSLSNTQM